MIDVAVAMSIPKRISVAYGALIPKVGRGVPIKAPPRLIKIAFLRLALETLADPGRCVDPRRPDALEDRIW